MSHVPFATSWIALLATAAPLFAAEHPLSAERRGEIEQSLRVEVAKLNVMIADDSKNVELYSRRGDAWFFLGKFTDAVADYEKMVELDLDLDASHWRRGIAYFYAERYKDAARQFEVYHTFDDVDRENGIWRFFSQAKAHGIEKAREGLLKYKKDDREPFPAVYQLFAGKLAPEELLKQIQAAQVSAEERQKRLFYAHLYIGLHYTIENKPEPARAHLAQSTANRWGPQAGYGPNYMWHVGRMQYELLNSSGE